MSSNHTSPRAFSSSVPTTTTTSPNNAPSTSSITPLVAATHPRQPHDSDSSSFSPVPPTLRVMRLQSPELHRSHHCPNALLETSLHTSLCLPDSLEVYVGETFTAYLGILNSSSHSPIRRLTVQAQLQTPSQRVPLPHTKLQTASDVPPASGVDAIVSRIMEEPGQHILRVEVSYADDHHHTTTTNEGGGAGGTKTFRKFYRFQVTAPLQMQVTVARMGDASCYVTLQVEYTKPPAAQASSSTGADTTTAAATTTSSNEKQDALLITALEIETPHGLTATPIGTTSLFMTANNPKDDTTTTPSQNQTPLPTAVQLWDATAGGALLLPGCGTRQFLYRIDATSSEALLRGLAAGDYLGRIPVVWRKAMGEMGQVYSPALHCPRCVLEPTTLLVDAMTGEGHTTTTTPRHYPSLGSNTASTGVVHRSGWSVDVAAAAAAAAPNSTTTSLASQFPPVTVEPIDPPSQAILHQSLTLQLLIVNHSSQPLPALQLQMHHPTVVGRSYQNLNSVLTARGGSTVARVQILPLTAGFLTVEGCVVVDLQSGQTYPQPPLCVLFVREEPVEDDPTKPPHDDDLVDAMR